MSDFYDYQANYDLVKTLTNFDDAMAVNVEIYLRESAAVDANEVTQYRPYWVAAKLLEQAPQHQQLASADGVGFTGMVRPIESYLELQRGLDRKYGWAVPDGFTALGLGEEPLFLNSGTTSIPNVSVF
ncbi:hypothetical protein VF14_03140 [Nostoc linckia z18]|jgi:hypothetical protein|uniref:Uncharacterized protein n=2 Tax=Nostoc linckia TaxID=92942 RepID=A0A9Q6ENE8_NOSLI|nr:hypothetical protein [Nostoc linckia]PHK42375.1 hypothetical protein VF12_03155 [Nostoc linckia z15]PHK46816.1 hypothetical protein VF13_09025 [Nostoc linckia z16]PHJ69145.1 hypothetical protein VF02_00610 [Nostoc linckia z1]PHJ73296.1 hypothetical protein VF05_01625 [Nostoc linckia z3]PHJ78643.1 hypothetical protein VF03_00610 [Nostoc linckia z2]